jgi:NAD(P)H-hydrate epimerase
MYRELPETLDHTISSSAIEPALAFVATKNAAVVGPGISTHPGTWAFVHGFVAQCAPPLVVDADGLNILAEDLAPLGDRASCSTILTPHPGEMARLVRMSVREVQESREVIARQLAAATGAIVVLKGHDTLIAHPDGSVAMNTTGNHGMATGGTGDVLAGLLGGLLAQGMDAWDAARLGVWLHGYAGDCAAAQFTARAMLARDLLACIPHAFGALETVG